MRPTDDVTLRTKDVREMEHQLNSVNEENLKICLDIHKQNPNSSQTLTQQTKHK